MRISWHGDYTNMELIIHVQTSVNYTQQITAVMYRADISNPGFDDYCRMTEVVVRGAEEAEIKFKISDSLNASGGAYKIRVQGNGYQSDNSAAEETVWLLRPADISDENGDGLLKQLNTAKSDNVKQYIEIAARALQLEVLEKESDKRLEAFVRVRDEVYNKNFRTMTEVGMAWKISGVIEYISQSNPDPSVMESKYAEIAEVLSVNMSDEIYNAYREDIYKNIILLNTSFNNGLGIQNFSDIEKIFAQARALAAINGSSLEDMEKNLKETYKDLDISTEIYNKFTNCPASDKPKILRQIFNKGFTKVSDITAVFIAAVNEISGSTQDSNNNLSTNVPGGGKGSSGGIAGGYSMQEETYQEPQTDITFRDCSTSHWAYPYVNSMKNSGIISGYPDGNFYPDRTVNREEFVKMVVLASGLYSESYTCDFSDVFQNQWYYNYIASANYSKIINGINEETFGVGQGITREDTAVIFCRVLNIFDVVNYDNDILSDGAQSFNDSHDMSDYAAQSISILADMNILNGFEDGSFMPQQYLSRAEAAKIVFMFKEHIRK